MKKLLSIISLLFMCVPAKAEPLKTVFNPFTGKPDYITRIDSNTVIAGANCTSTSNPSGTVTITCSGSGSPALTSTAVGFGNLSNLLTGDATAFNWDNTALTQAIIHQNSGGVYFRADDENIGPNIDYVLEMDGLGATPSAYFGFTNTSSGGGGPGMTFYDGSKVEFARLDVNSKRMSVGSFGTSQGVNTLGVGGNVSIGTTTVTAPTSGLYVVGNTIHVGTTTFNGNINISSGIFANSSTGTNGQFLTSGGPGTIPTWTTSAGGGGGASTLQMTLSGVQITSPTASINNYSGDFVMSAIGSTSTIALNPATTDFIHAQSTLQTGATFYVSSGTISGQFANTGQATFSGGLDSRQANAAGNVSGITLRNNDANSANTVSLDFYNGQSGGVIDGQIKSYRQGTLNGDMAFLVSSSLSGGVSEALRITGEGKVGIGITAPAASLEVNGSLLIDGPAISTFTYGVVVGSLAVTSGTTTINGVKMIWPSSGTIGNVLSYTSTNTLQWVAQTGGASLASTQTWTGQNNWTTPAPSTFTYGVSMGSATINGPAWIVNASSANSLAISSTSTGVLLVQVSSSPAVNPQDYLLNVSSTSGTTTFGAQNGGHIVSSGTYVPALSSCGAGSSVSGTDTAFTITGGTGATGCTATFGYAFVNTPVCVISQQSMSVVNALTYTTSSTAITITQTGLGTAKLDILCIGNKG